MAGAAAESDIKPTTGTPDAWAHRTNRTSAASCSARVLAALSAAWVHSTRRAAAEVSWFDRWAATAESSRPSVACARADPSRASAHASDGHRRSAANVTRRMS